MSLLPKHGIASHVRSATAIVSTLLFAAGTAAQAAPSIAPGRFWVQSGASRLVVPYASNRPIDQPDAAIDRVIFVVHGSGREASTYMTRVRNPALALGVEGSTLIVAPQFLIADDFAAFPFLGNDYLYWSGGWREGDLSASSTSSRPRPFRYSSFAVVDRMVEAIADPSLFPNLRHVVITGHSAGGQYANRYAAGSPVEDTVLRPRGITASYVVSAPSSFVYLGPERRVGSSTDTFAVPPASTIATCPTYDHYKHGLVNLNSYMSAIGASAIRDSYARRRVAILIGSLDTATSGGGLATDCASMLQGTQRLERALTYFNHLQFVFGPSILAQHRLAIVPGVGHSSAGNYDSAYGRRFLFDHDDGTARILRVDANTPFTGGTGINWAFAFRRLDDAIRAAAVAGGDVREIWVANGTYAPGASVADPAHSFQLLDGVGIYGGFAGFDSTAHPGGETARSQRDPFAHTTVLSGSSFTWQVVTASHTSRTAVLDGFVIANGFATGPGDRDEGGGLFAASGSPTIRTCFFWRNLARYGGGIALREQSAPWIEGCWFYNNGAEQDGGALSANASAPVVVETSFLENFALDDGGAVRLYDANAELWSCRFVGNGCLDHGGGLYDGTGSSSTGSLACVDGLLHGNFALNRGGACAVIGTSAFDFDSCTITDNLAVVAGGALYASQAPPNIANSILWGDTGGELAGVAPLIAYSCVQGGAAGVAVTSLDPRFEDPLAANYALSALSPCIDAGLDVLLPPDRIDLDGDGNPAEPLPLDLAGQDRSRDGDGDLVRRTDMGALER